MRELKLGVATLLICFLIGGVVAQLLPAPIVASPQIPMNCNPDCFTYRCVCDTCRIEGTQALGWKVYRVYQSNEYIGCDGPYDCFWDYDHCGPVNCCTHIE